MGYTTDFTGHLNFDKPLTAEQVKYIQTFSRTRRMARDVKELRRLYNGEYGLNGNYGKEGEYFCKNDGDHGQTQDASIITYNHEPSTQPSLWCQWTVSDDGARLEWDGGEKFYSYVEWLEYMIANFFRPWGCLLNGEIKWQGEDSEDVGKIIVADNIVTTKKGHIVYE
jgi:hypothetical protein